MSNKNRNKKIYNTKRDAKRAIEEHNQKFKQKMRAYRCKCNGLKHYHLTSQIKRRAVILQAGEIIEEIY